MTFLNEAIRHPQRLFLRRALFQVHLWTGIGLGLYMLVIAISGAAIVFQDEMENALHSHLTQVANAAGPQADAASAIHNASSAYPGFRVRSISLPTGTVRTFGIEMRKDKSRIMAYAHPVTARILGHHDRDGSVLGWLNDLHHNLLAGKTGRIVNGVGGLFLFLLCLTGMVIWWPGVKNWKRALTVDVSKKWKRVNWDLHSASGFWSLLLIAMWAITGAYFAWPAQFRSAINYFSPVTTVKQPESNFALKNLRPAPVIGDLVQRAREASPGRLSRISFPDNDQGTIRLAMALGDLDDRRYADNLYFDQFSGQLLLTSRRGVNKTVGDVIVYWISPVHFGTFGGVTVKILWVVLGLAPAVLFATGSLMWWNRVLSKKWARLKAGQLDEEHLIGTRHAVRGAIGADVNSSRETLRSDPSTGALGTEGT